MLSEINLETLPSLEKLCTLLMSETLIAQGDIDLLRNPTPNQLFTNEAVLLEKRTELKNLLELQEEVNNRIEDYKPRKGMSLGT